MVIANVSRGQTIQSVGYLTMTRDLRNMRPEIEKNAARFGKNAN